MKKIIFVVVTVAVVGFFVYLSFKYWTGLNVRPTPTASQSNLPYEPPVVEPLEQLGSPPLDNASDADRNVFAEKLRSLAQSVSVVAMGQDCVLSPAIISVKSGSNLTFKNTDTVDHNLSIAEQIKVPTGKEVTIKAVFRGAGIYGINCDGLNIVGFIDLHE